MDNPIKSEKERKLAIVLGVAGIAVTLALFGSKAKAAPVAATDPNANSEPLLSTLGDSSSAPATTGMDPIAAALQLAQGQEQNALDIATVQADNSKTFTLGLGSNFTDSAALNTTSSSGSSSGGGGGFLGGLLSSLFGGGGNSNTASTTSNSNLAVAGGSNLNIGATGLNDAELQGLINATQTLDAAQNQSALALQEQGQQTFTTVTQGTNTAVGK